MGVSFQPQLANDIFFADVSSFEAFCTCEKVRKREGNCLRKSQVQNCRNRRTFCYSDTTFFVNMTTFWAFNASRGLCPGRGTGELPTRPTRWVQGGGGHFPRGKGGWGGEGEERGGAGEREGAYSPRGLPGRAGRPGARLSTTPCSPSGSSSTSPNPRGQAPRRSNPSRNSVEPLLRRYTSRWAGGGGVGAVFFFKTPVGGGSGRDPQPVFQPKDSPPPSTTRQQRLDGGQ